MAESLRGTAGFEVHHRPAGSVMIVACELDGQSFTALNGPPVFRFNEAVSLQVNCATQDEIDYCAAAGSETSLLLDVIAISDQGWEQTINPDTI